MCAIPAAGDDDLDHEDDDYAHNIRNRVVRSRQAISVQQASITTAKVLATVHSSLQTLLTADDLNLGALQVARQYLAGTDEEVELQVRQWMFACKLCK